MFYLKSSLKISFLLKTTRFTRILPRRRLFIRELVKSHMTLRGMGIEFRLEFIMMITGTAFAEKQQQTKWQLEGGRYEVGTGLFDQEGDRGLPQ
jgi:hypothetical protein